jgi:hypothetical protein
MSVKPASIVKIFAAAAAVPFLLSACSGSPESACGEVFEEEFDTQSSLHIAEGTEVKYLTWPPTSGPHTSGAIPSGNIAQPLSGPVQVSILEAGQVLIQYEGASEGEIKDLTELAAENVVVARGERLPQKIVTTAWTTKQTCGGVDMGSHREFIEVYALPGPPG